MTTTPMLMIEQLAGVISEAIARLKRGIEARVSKSEDELAQLRERVDIDARANKEFRDGVREQIAEHVNEVRAALPTVEALVTRSASLVSADMPDISGLISEEHARRMIDEQVQKYVSEMRGQIVELEAKLGAIPSVDELARSSARMVEVPTIPDVSRFIDEGRAVELIKQALADLPAPVDVAALLGDMLDRIPTSETIALRAAALVPTPKDGVSITIDDVRPLLLGMVKDLMPTGEEISAIIGRTYVNAWALEFERRAQDLLQRTIDRMPTPENGVDGKDGMGFDDLVIEYDGERMMTIALVQGERRKAHTFKFPIMIYRGIYTEGVVYERGDSVTWGGSSWVALKDAPQGKPGDASKDWRLVVKRGRDGH